jgi:uncharacterized damage-inducible protein DinB
MTQATPVTQADHFRRWFEYERNSHAKTVISLETVPRERRTERDWQRATDLMAHVTAARMMWLFRLGVEPEPPNTLFPQNVALSELRKRLTGMERKWLLWLDRIDDRELDRELEYKSLDAGHFRGTVRDILTQLFGHSLYHRGQIAMLVRSLGGSPAVTDFIYWSRTPAEG